MSVVDLSKLELKVIRAEDLAPGDMVLVEYDPAVGPQPDYHWADRFFPKGVRFAIAEKGHVNFKVLSQTEAEEAQAQGVKFREFL